MGGTAAVAGRIHHSEPRLSRFTQQLLELSPWHATARGRSRKAPLTNVRGSAGSASYGAATREEAVFATGCQAPIHTLCL
jgi:hypothetical protein